VSTGLYRPRLAGIGSSTTSSVSYSTVVTSALGGGTYTPSTVALVLVGIGNATAEVVSFLPTNTSTWTAARLARITSGARGWEVWLLKGFQFNEAPTGQLILTAAAGSHIHYAQFLDGFTGALPSAADCTVLTQVGSTAALTHPTVTPTGLGQAVVFFNGADTAATQVAQTLTDGLQEDASASVTGTAMRVDGAIRPYTTLDPVTYTVPAFSAATNWASFGILVPRPAQPTPYPETRLLKGRRTLTADLAGAA
jgi:hypothetical protein